MNQQLHTNHMHHLESLQAQSKIAGVMLKNELSEDERQAISQGKAITDMQFENGLRAFMKPHK